MTDSPRPRECECYYTMIKNDGDAETFVPKADYTQAITRAEAAERDNRILRSECTGLNNGRGRSDKELYAKLAKAEAKLEEVMSYLPKVPTEPYEKQLARKVHELEAKLANDELNFKAIEHTLDLAHVEIDQLEAKLAEVTSENDKLTRLLNGEEVDLECKNPGYSLTVKLEAILTERRVRSVLEKIKGENK